MVMSRMSAPAGRVQSSSETVGTSPTREAHETTDAQDTEDTRHPTDQVATIIDDTPAGADSTAGLDADAPPLTTVMRNSISEPTISKSPPSPGQYRSESLPATTESSRGGSHGLLAGSGSRGHKPSAMPFLAAFAKFAAFTDVFLSGLVIPLIPAILQARGHAPHQQVQIWTSVLVSAYGGAFAVVSPLMPLLTRQGTTGYVVLFAGLAFAAMAFALFQFSSHLSLLILARALQGFAAAAVTAATSAMLATSTAHCLSWLTPAFIQSAAMTTAPFVAGLLHSCYSVDAVFYCAYAVIALNLALVVATLGLTKRNASDREGASFGFPESGTPRCGYGTVSAATSESGERSPRSLSPRSPAARPSRRHASEPTVASTPWASRLLVAWCGYLVVALLTSALYSVLPLFVQRHFNWSVFTSGYMFVALSAPAAVVGLVSGLLAARVPKSARFLTAIGFLACLPAFWYLGQLRANTDLVQHAFLLALCAISFATGLCGDPLVREITAVAGLSLGGSWSATAHAASLPNLAGAWGTLVGPLFAGAINWLWGWEIMTKSLAIVAAISGVVALLFLQGWFRSPYPEVRTGRLEASSDEESAPLLANDRSNRSQYGALEAYSNRKEVRYAQRHDSDDVSPHTRSGGDRKERRHRRHFSVDNFSVATTAAGSMDSSTSSVRFQAALETPVQGTSHSGSKRLETSDTASKSSSERRYVMREAPHAPATDPLLAAGSLYVIDEERDTAAGVESERQKRRVVVFPEGTAPPELLERHRHHVVAINALDGTAQMVSDTTDNHAVHVTEETAEDGSGFSEATSRRYVVVVVEGEESGSE